MMALFLSYFNGFVLTLTMSSAQDERVQEDSTRWQLDGNSSGISVERPLRGRKGCSMGVSSLSRAAFSAMLDAVSRESKNPRAEGEWEFRG